MNISKFIQEMMRKFLLIFALIIIVMTILRQIYDPDLAFDLKSIYIIMAFSFVSVLIGFILHAPSDISEKQMRIRIAVHFSALEMLLIVLAIVMGIVNSASQAAILALQIAGIYILVRLLSWKKDQKEAEDINEKLRAFKRDAYE